MLPRTESEIDEFLAAFEDCTLPKARWTHGAHLLTGACYVHALGEAAATEKMRHCIPRYNVAVGGQNTDTSGYHETITVLWIRLLARLLREAETSGPVDRAAFAALALSRFEHDREVLRRYYDFDVVNSVEARRMWIPPTLAPLD
ncbi:MAG TPA: hypothetical protein VG714_01500 [Acidobacteriaceae bacterium]|nr:hypothetical protein [Acidobacteriaceae bacterium]